MTIIAWKAGIMACDSCWATNDVIDNLACKIYRLKNGGLMGQAGDNDARDVAALFDSVKDPRTFPSRKELHEFRLDFLGLLVLPKGRVFKVSTTNQLLENCEDDIGIWEIMLPYAAIGSGHEIAIGAMSAGKSAAEAAAIACRHVTSCRPPIHTRPLEVPKPKLRKKP